MSTQKVNTLESLRALVARETSGAAGRLPPERELARLLGASRGTVRRALMHLEMEGMIRRRVGQGTFLLAPHGSQTTNPVSRFTSPTEIMEARAVIEPELASMAALRGSADEIRAMNEAILAGARETDLQGFERADRRLHRAIAAAAHNRLLLRVFDDVNASRDDALWGRLRAKIGTPERMARSHDEHRAVVSAIEARDPAEACRSMRAHLESVSDALLRSA
jgi:GntR family transcriptional regulator, uxu operon transcriptional repressor